MSPLVATGVLNLGDWVRDDLPDLVWPILVLSECGTHGARRFVRWQKDVQDDLSGQTEARFLAECLDGRLTGLDRLADELSDAREVVVRRAGERGLLLDSVSAALATYPDRPARWLIDLDLRPPSQADVDLLARAILDVQRDGHREAVVKCLSIWSSVQAAVFSTSSEVIDLLKTYPEDLEQRAKADTVIRAMWGANKSALAHQDTGHFDASLRWAKLFWGFNSITTRCVRKRDHVQNAGGDVTEPDSGTQNDEGAKLKSEDLRQRAMDLASSYVEALESAPARLWDPERQEVHSGLVVRAAHDVIAVLGAPDLWCSEHGAHISRMLVELRITLRWMSVQDDPSIYQQYKEYGAGKAKLYARLMAEMPEEWMVPEAREALGALGRLSHNDDMIDFRVVDLRSTFAEGKTLREMADECGLLDLYRYGYQLNSGIAHSEWWSVEMHCMEPCRNVLHRGHLIPSLTLSAGENEGLARAWLIGLYGLIRESLAILDTDASAVETAFAWLSDRDDPRAEGSVDA
jgi:hypothetical protein